MEQWYTLYTKPNAEYQVAEALRQRGIQTYLPEIETGRQDKRRRQQPFFPCYLFVKVDLKAIGLSAVQWTPGLRRLVAFGEQPVPLPEAVINLIRQQLGELEAGGGWPAHPFKPGDTVGITAGPFRNMLAIFEGPTQPGRRVQVLLAILGHLSRVQLDPADLTKVTAPVTAPRPERPRRSRGRGRPIGRSPS